MPFASVGDLILHYQRDGLETGPTLVLLHSLGTDLRIWDDVIPHFVEKFRIVRYDLRGHGLSDCPPGPYSMQDHVADLTGLMNSLGIERSVFIGISVGGMVALAYAAAQPAQLDALVLIDTGLAIGTPAAWNDRIENLRHGGMGPMVETILPRWFAPSFIVDHPLEYRGYANMLMRTPLDGYIASCAALRDTDLHEIAHAVTTRTFVMSGSEDISTPPEVGRTLAQSLSDSRFSVIAGVGHLPCIEQPDTLATAIENFLQELGIKS
jgi:3-oxoadipate enol-lactonase